MAKKTSEDEKQEPYIVCFECYSCRKIVEIDLYAAQQDRLEFDYSQIKPDPEDPQRYYLKCTDCKKFNAVFI